MDLFSTIFLQEGSMNTPRQSAVVLLEEEHAATIGPVPIFKKRSWQKPAGMFSGKQSLGSILVVDDDPTIRKLLRLILENDRYDVIEAEDGQNAIDLLGSEDPPMGVDAIITDLNIPKVDGFEVIAYCKKEYPKIPLIVLTGNSDVQLATSLMRQGVTDYLVKPIDAKKLTALVASVIAQRPLS